MTHKKQHKSRKLLSISILLSKEQKGKCCSKQERIFNLFHTLDGMFT